MTQRGLFREDSFAGRALDLLDLLRSPETAQFLSEFDLIGFVDLKLSWVTLPGCDLNGRKRAPVPLFEVYISAWLFVDFFLLLRRLWIFAATSQARQHVLLIQTVRYFLQAFLTFPVLLDKNSCFVLIGESARRFSQVFLGRDDHGIVLGA